MHDPLNIPEELQHLIEKREVEDRRQQDIGPVGAADSESVESQPSEAASTERRKSVRRTTDQEQ